MSVDKVDLLDTGDSAAPMASISRTRGFEFFLLPSRVHARSSATLRRRKPLGVTQGYFIAILARRIPLNQKTLIIVLAVTFLCCCLVIIGGGLIFFFSGNSTSQVSELTPLMISRDDLPNGWESARYMYTLPYEVGTLATMNSVFDYIYPGDNYAKVWLSHEIFLYPSDEAAAAGYEKMHKEWINNFLEEIDVSFTFAPRNPADKFDKHCTYSSKSGIYSCDFVQRHGMHVILLRSLYDNKVMTAAQLDIILQRLDAKLP